MNPGTRATPWLILLVEAAAVEGADRGGQAIYHLLRRLITHVVVLPVAMRQILFPLVAVSFLVGCGGAVVYEGDLRTGQFTKVRGISTMQDAIKHSIGFELEMEQRGERPNAGAKTWAAYWEHSIKTWRKYGNQEAEAYYYRRRKELGLSRGHSS